MDNPSRIKKAFAEMAKGMDALALANMKPPTEEAETIRSAVEINGHKQVMDQLFNLAEVFQEIKKEYKTQFSNTFIEVPMDASTQKRNNDPEKFPVDAGFGVFLSAEKNGKNFVGGHLIILLP